ncbi:hypothetical protein [Streptomyces sp. 8N616]|uniref:hypothetical protein n=1 Tax=Streptomyces sp. 8N616 TaxID=3457414 RepID=UPI003FCF326B
MERSGAESLSPGSTTSALERTFATIFNTGHGTAWYEEGERTGEAEWNHLGLQDRLPGRRWAVRTGVRLTATGGSARWRLGALMAGGAAVPPGPRGGPDHRVPRRLRR